MRVYTDYPLLTLGDIEGEEAPIREVEAIHYDGDKRVKVVFEGCEYHIKAGYLYPIPARCGEVSCVNPRKYKNVNGHYVSSKAAQITKSWVVYPPNYSHTEGIGPFYYRFLKKAWSKALSLGEGATCIQKLRVSKRDGSCTWSGGDVEYEVVKR